MPKADNALLPSSEVMGKETPLRNSDREGTYCHSCPRQQCEHRDNDNRKQFLGLGDRFEQENVREKNERWKNNVFQAKITETAKRTLHVSTDHAG